MVAIKVVTVLEVDIGLKRPSTIPLVTVEKYLMLTGDVDIGLRPSTLPPITQVSEADCQVYNCLLVLLTKMLINIRDWDIVVMAIIWVVWVEMMVTRGEM